METLFATLGQLFLHCAILLVPGHKELKLLLWQLWLVPWNTCHAQWHKYTSWGLPRAEFRGWAVKHPLWANGSIHKRNHTSSCLLWFGAHNFFLLRALHCLEASLTP